MNNTIAIDYTAGPSSPSVRLLIDGDKHPWWEVCDHIAAKWISDFNPNAPDAVFDRIMKNRADKQRKHARDRNR